MFPNGKDEFSKLHREADKLCKLALHLTKTDHAYRLSQISYDELRKSGPYQV